MVKRDYIKIMAILMLVRLASITGIDMSGAESLNHWSVLGESYGTGLSYGTQKGADYHIRAEGYVICK